MKRSCELMNKNGIEGVAEQGKRGKEPGEVVERLRPYLLGWRA